MANKARVYTWFLEPIGNWTNKVIAERCDKETDFQTERICSDGRPHDLWKCTETVRDAIIASKDSLKLVFRIFCQEGNGQIRNVTFLFRPKKPAIKSEQKATK